MRYRGLLIFTLIFSFPAFAGMSAAERCQKEGEVAEKASDLRIAGVDKETATDTLIKLHEGTGKGLTTDRIRGLVTVSYTAKMKPEKMRDYAVDQCKKSMLH